MAVFRMKYLHPITKKKTGKTYWYFRRKGFPDVPLPGQPGTQEFRAAYEKAFSAQAPTVGSEINIPGSITALFVSYRQSREFGELRPQSKITYTGIMERFAAKHGHRPAATLTGEKMAELMQRMDATPAAANGLLKVMRVIMQYAVRKGILKTNPLRHVERMKYVKKPFPTWSDEHIGLFESHWPLGTIPRLAMSLLLYTGQRRQDVYKLGPQHMRDGYIDITQAKTGERLRIPVHPALKTAMDAMPAANLVFLTTSRGKPFSTTTGFYNSFAGWCRAAGLPPGLSPHGLRKAAARRLAEAGCTPHQIASITGHRTLAMVAHYSREADQAKLATAAVARLGEARKGEQ